MNIHAHSVTLAVLVSIALSAGHWLSAATHIGFRGDGSGIFTADAAPQQWNGQTGSNILWRTEMPGISASSPIVVGKRVFTLSEPDWLLCLDADSGKELWRQQADAFADKPQVRQELDTFLGKVQSWWYASSGGSGLGKKPYGKIPSHLHKEHKLPNIVWPEANYSLATPVSDGQCVFVTYATGAIACYEFDGTKRWQALVEPRSRPAEGPSGLVVDGLFCISTRLHRSKQNKNVRQHHMLAFDVKTGEQRWKTKLMPGPGGDPSSTPSLITVGKRQLIVSASGYVIDPADGSFLATRIGISGDGCSAVVRGNTIYFLEGGGKGDVANWTGRGASTAYAVTLQDVNGKIEFKRGPEIPFATGRIRTYASPIVHQNRLYAVTNGRFLIGDLSTGAVIPEPDKFHRNLFRIGLNKEEMKKFGKLDRNMYPSPILIDDIMYLFKADTTCAVIQLGPTPKKLYTNILALGKERMASSPFVHDNRIYIRTMRSVFCIGKQ